MGLLYATPFGGWGWCPCDSGANLEHAPWGYYTPPPLGVRGDARRAQWYRPRTRVMELLYATPSYIAGKGSMISLEASEEVVRL